MRIVNIGILAHVDAGKTTLTDQILFHAGVIAKPGSVDHGTTQTDALDLERERGITIQSAVVSFTRNNLKVNLIDTPGHPDFIAEVERALSVLDGVVLVISAVEGIQAQTRRLAAAIQSIGLPSILVINKIDRVGARVEPLLTEIRQKLGFDPILLGAASNVGTRQAAVSPRLDVDATVAEELSDLLTRYDDELLREWIESGLPLSMAQLESGLASQSRRGLIHPVFPISAGMGIGIERVLDAIERYLPPAKEATPNSSLDGVVFKVRRDKRGERLVYARIFDGQIEVRQPIPLVRSVSSGEKTRTLPRLVALDGFENGQTVPLTSASAGEIVLLHGLAEARIGDHIGEDTSFRHVVRFAPPVLESLIHPLKAVQRIAFNRALEELSDYDPLITLRRDRERGDVSVRLYGDVQKEVIADMLLRDFEVPVVFEVTRIVCAERPIGVGEAVEVVYTASNPFTAGVGLRVEPGEPGSGFRYHRELGALPRAFYTAIEDSIRQTLQEGPHGWEVIDIDVTLIHAGYCSVNSTAGDFRKLTPLMLMEALMAAGTEVCEPLERFELDVPDEMLTDVVSALGGIGALVEQSVPHGAGWRVEGTIPTSGVQPFEQRLPGMTSGEADFVSRFESWQPIIGEPPTRSRTDHDPTDRRRYLLNLSGRM